MKKILVLIALVATNFSFAGQDSGSVSISKIGCHLEDSTCYVHIDKVVGPVDCSSSSVRWDKDASKGGNAALTLLTAAYFAGKKVQFNISDSCYGKYPTFHYFNVNNG
ncbi:hypothetical protein [Microbulbifer hydrolyticus]|uniref:Uncharacterized protein n=1 Tax=Microbulbifer hydrolyticus TaxID=48074 RepID=A0A6P1TCZ5_9GAMM|nr:hypothetical protein [Microbulbifer hydrolyticus]MBB5211999.1 hypothetical protein [Microbulbifer hydrolyticus]QHQ39681.1 hypothetical protein GTQ55_12250 [Microbulbifer hydrolyticus]